MSKKIRIWCFCLILPVLIFFSSYLSIPSNIHLTKDSKYTLYVNSFCGISEQSVEASNNGEALFTQKNNGIELNTSSVGNYEIHVKMLNIIPLKKVNVAVSGQYYVKPSGSPIGIKLYSDGLLVVNISQVKVPSGKSVSPAKEAGLKEGDRILTVNGEKVNISEDLSRIITASEGELNLEVARGEEMLDLSLLPMLSSDGQSKKIGIWVRDSTAGVGTLTFFDPKTMAFATLGHAITDVDTGDIIIPKKGSITDCEIVYSKKGTAGNPGELSGIIGKETMGDIRVNSDLGVYGKIDNTANLSVGEYMPVATRFQVKKGEAYILADVDGNGVKRYDVEVEEVSQNSSIDNRGLVIKVTDDDLIEKTGGIVQGMSGAPIIQNNFLIGAVTHVFINDPTRGYGIFAENMLDIVAKLQ